MEYLLKSHFPTCQKSFIKQPAEKICKTENQKDRGMDAYYNSSSKATLMFTEMQITWWAPVKAGEVP